MKDGINFSTFDLFHAQYVKMLDKAKHLFDCSVVGLQILIDRFEKKKGLNSLQ